MVNVFDIKWHLNDIDSFNQLFLEQVENNTQIALSSINLHSIYLYYKDEAVRSFIDSTPHAHIDGMPVVWLMRLNGDKVAPSYRITWVDWMMPLLKFCAEHQMKVFYLGSNPGVADNAFKRISESIPGLLYQTRDGYFNMSPPENQENLAVIKTINDYAPQLLIVGMGMGRQEKWLLENQSQLNANVIITSGAAAEYFSGDVKVPPRWMGRMGLEWLFRFTENPKRFWHRYLIEPWYIMGLAAKQKLKKQK